MTPDAIKLAREELGWSQSECAKRAGVSIRQMRAFEVGAFVPRDAKRKLTIALQTEPPPERPKPKRHQFTRTEASAAGKLGGLSVSQDREHMRNIGRKGGLVRKAVLPAILLMLASCADKPNLRAELVGPPKQDGCRGDRACENYWCPGHPCKE